MYAKKSVALSNNMIEAVKKMIRIESPREVVHTACGNA